MATPTGQQGGGVGGASLNVASGTSQDVMFRVPRGWRISSLVFVVKADGEVGADAWGIAYRFGSTPDQAPTGRAIFNAQLIPLPILTAGTAVLSALDTTPIVLDLPVPPPELLDPDPNYMFITVTSSNIGITGLVAPRYEPL